MTERQSTFVPGLRLRIFLGESQGWEGKPLGQALLELAWSQGIAEATIFRGIEGFGPEHLLSTERFPDVADNLPVIVEMIDEEASIERILFQLDEMVNRGMITTTPVRILKRGAQI